MRYILYILVLFAAQAYGQTVKVSGAVKSLEGDVIPYAHIIDSINNKAVYADNTGNFSMVVRGGDCLLKASHVSFSNKYVSFKVQRDTFITITLSEIEIPEVLVKGTPLSQQGMLGLNFLESKSIQNIPSFFGEPDIIKTMTVLPGISSGLDLYSGIFVRGGNRDQNLFLVDGARYYSTSHFGGYLSLFNPDIINHIDVYKGIAPAKFGDGISSVVDIRLNEGSNSPKMNIDIGTMRSGILIETGGTGKVKAMLAGRFSHIDLISGSAFKNFVNFNELEEDKEFIKINFWDIDGKISYKPSPRTSVSLNGHLGNDQYVSYYQGDRYIEKIESNKVIDSNGNYIDNHNVTLNMKHLFKNGVSIKNTTWFTYYNLALKSKEEYYIDSVYAATFNYEKSTYVKDLSNRFELQVMPGERNLINTGFQVSLLTVNPSVITEYDEINLIDSTFTNGDQNGIEGAIFIEDDFKLFNNSKLKLGIRSSVLYAADSACFSLEPRLSLSHRLSGDWSLRFGYSRNYQPLHTLVQTYGAYEKEIWLLADSHYKPQLADQVSGGIFGAIPGTSIDLSLEMYYKGMQNLLYLNPIAYDSKDMFDYIYKDGEGRSAGVELLLQKTNGKIQWSVAYTLSWSQRRFDELNSGEWFYSEFDRRHDLNIGLHYFSGKKNTWNFNYVFQSGRPFTMPVAQVNKTSFFTGFYVIDGVNNARMPAYNRFDVSYKRRGNFLWKRKYELTLSVLNLFANKNPAGMFVRDDKLYMTSLYVVIPSINFKVFLFE
ncbi:MAG: TonB-dependent receptor [Prolixibacteraceae bacterium]|nr:TonB-dependent receptor [Prolixibacteraceae bacterium]